MDGNTNTSGLELKIKQEENEIVDENDIKTEKDDEEENCNLLGDYNNAQELKELIAESCVEGAVGNTKKEFEAVLTEVFLTPIKEELEDNFLPDCKDPLEIKTDEESAGDESGEQSITWSNEVSDLPICAMKRGGVPQNENTIKDEGNKTIMVNVLKGSTGEKLCGKRKCDVILAEIERNYNLKEGCINEVQHSVQTKGVSTITKESSAMKNQHCGTEVLTLIREPAPVDCASRTSSLDLTRCAATERELNNRVKRLKQSMDFEASIHKKKMEVEKLYVKIQELKLKFLKEEGKRRIEKYELIMLQNKELHELRKKFYKSSSS